MVDDREVGEVVVVWLGVTSSWYVPGRDWDEARSSSRAPFRYFPTWLPVGNSLGLAALPRVSNGGARCQGSWGLWDFGQCAQTTTLPTFSLRLRDAHDWWHVSHEGGCPNSVIRGFESTVMIYGCSRKLEWGTFCTKYSEPEWA